MFRSQKPPDQNGKNIIFSQTLSCITFPWYAEYWSLIITVQLLNLLVWIQTRPAVWRPPPSQGTRRWTVGSIVRNEHDAMQNASTLCSHAVWQSPWAVTYHARNIATCGRATERLMQRTAVTFIVDDVTQQFKGERKTYFRTLLIEFSSDSPMLWPMMENLVHWRSEKVISTAVLQLGTQ